MVPYDDGGTVFGGDPDAAHRRIDEWQESLERRAAQAQQLATAVADLRADGFDANRIVRASVDSRGRLIGLTIDERAQGWPPSRMAAAVQAAVTAAQDAVAAQARSIIVDAGLGDVA
jgi:hypothetical protein